MSHQPLHRGFRQVTCTSCGKSGRLYVGRQLASGEYKVEDEVSHDVSCPHYVRRQPEHLRKKTSWQRQERRANALVGARPTAGSGAFGLDGDGRSFHGWRTESKQTASGAYTLTQAVWSKLVNGASLAGEEPLLHVELRHSIPSIRRVVIRESLYITAHADWQPPTHPTKQTHRISDDSPYPLPVSLDPPGVEISEEQFVDLKRRLDAEQNT